MKSLFSGIAVLLTLLCCAALPGYSKPSGHRQIAFIEPGFVMYNHLDHCVRIETFVPGGHSIVRAGGAVPPHSTHRFTFPGPFHEYTIRAQVLTTVDCDAPHRQVSDTLQVSPKFAGLVMDYDIKGSSGHYQMTRHG